MKQTRNIRNVLIEEFYSEEDGKVYWNYRFQGGEWYKQLTPLNKLPYVEWRNKI